MVVRTLSDFLVEVGDDDHLQDQLFLAVKYDSFQQSVVAAINEIFRDIKEESLFIIQDKNDDAEMKEKCSNCQIIEGLVQESNFKFLTEGPEAAAIFLKNRREEQRKKCNEGKGICSDDCLNLITHPIMVYETVKRIVNGSMDDLEEKRQKWKKIEPQKCAENLSSLSNPHRLSILKLLKSDQRSFSELSSKTGLRTGHLQFHLRTLMEKDLVKKEERGIYGLNDKGSQALDYLVDFERLMSTLYD